VKLGGRDARRMIEAPDPGLSGFLLYGSDSSAVSMRRDRLVAGLLGEAADDMSLTKLDAAAVRRDPASLSDALRAVGFFGGRQVVVLLDATDGLTKVVSDALDGVAPEDAVLVASAGSLAARSSLRKLFEGGKTLAALGIYADPPSRREIEETLSSLGAPAPDSGGADDLLALGRALDAGEFQAFLRKLALYMASESGPISSADVAACAPLATEEAVDDLVASVAGGRLDALAAGMARLSGQGVAPSTLSIAVTRHFRQLHALATASGGAEGAIGRVRPPIWGPRRQALLDQTRQWSVRGLEQALGALASLELELRSSSGAPALALLERALLRIALTGRRRA
jgi:DNA polymerase-3 subunit delta